MNLLNETHSPDLSSWVLSANGHQEFPIQNLPLAIFRRRDSDEAFRAGVAIGDMVLDLPALQNSGVFAGPEMEILKCTSDTSLNRLMSMGQAASSALRLALSRSLREGAGRDIQAVLAANLISQAEVEFDLPCCIGDYTDFYSSINHATSVGRLFRPEQPLLPNYKWVPIGYHGRSSSIGISGQRFNRPLGQRKGEVQPEFGPTERLDYELELGIFIGEGTRLGERIDIAEAEKHVFGVCLFNDWSARDIQAWEYQPLGPFLGKNFASTISPWIVTLEALAPFRVGFSRPPSDPPPLDYLSSKSNSEQGAWDIQMEVLIQTQRMRDAGESAVFISGSSFKHSYWTAAQMVTHHSINGCNMNPGDLLGSGTQSGPSPDQAGSLLELSEGGKRAISLPNGEQRTFVEDGDRVVLRAYCAGDNRVRIGLGEASATVLPAIS